MTLTTRAADLVANNLEVAAPIVALVASWVLYGVLGKHVLGADDDYWPFLRNLILPILHVAGATSGLYAKGEVLEEEFVGVVQMTEDEIERELEAAGFYRNPLSAVKVSPNGWQSDGSWARRYGRLQGFATLLRSIEVPVAGALGRMVGRFLAASGDILARRQTDVTLFTQTRGGDNYVWLFAHDEPNSLNPLTAWRHYLARSWNAQRGVDEVRGVLEERGIDYDTEV